MILVIDNYDSFTFNLVQALEAAGADVRVVRNDRSTGPPSSASPTRRRADAAGYPVSPGPGDPATPACRWTPSALPPSAGFPLLGVCLGLQSIGAVFGAGDRARADARSRRGNHRGARGGRRARGPALAICGGEIPLAVRGRDHAAGGARCHRALRRRRGHGHAPPQAPPRGCAVPSRVGADAGGPARPRQLPAARRRGRPGALDAAARSFATRAGELGPRTGA